MIARSLRNAKSPEWWLTINVKIRVAAAVYFIYSILVYWPVILGRRFFWEDFFIKEYPIREFSYYMLAIRHALPFWNPYSWAWEPFLADAQSGFWYPASILQIVAGHILNKTNLPSIIPEGTTICEMSIAALGIFYLLRKEFRVSTAVSLLAGFTFGFGARMVAEQNHVVFVNQLALLPWETLLLMRSWRSWKNAIALGILFGISFLAGQQQVFLFIALFLAFFTAWECMRRRRIAESWSHSLHPLLNFTLAIIVTTGIAAIQLLPLLELTGASGRQHLSYHDASVGSMHPFRFISLFVPKFFGEFPNYLIPKNVDRSNGMWYWEGIFYWGVLAEIVAVFGIIRLWNRRKSANPRARYIGFFVAFSIFAVAYGMGSYGGVQWLFWRFVPIFDHIRMPNRMVWFVWFLGSLATAFGLEELVRNADNLHLYKRYFYWSSAVFIALNALAMTGVFQYFIKPHHYRQDPLVILHSAVASIAVLVFFLLFINRKIAARWLFPCAVLLIVLDLYYVDFTWHRNTLDRETMVAKEAVSKPLLDFKRLHGTDHSKLLLLERKDLKQMDENLGMFLRLPIEFSNDSNGLLADNPLRMVDLFPPVRDSIRRMEIMGVSMTIKPDGREVNDSAALPFVQLYHHWVFAKDRSEESRILNDSSFNFKKTIVLREPPAFRMDTVKGMTDSITLSKYSENELSITVRTSTAGIVFVNDLFYPDWQATVDGKETKIIRAFSSLRAVPVSPGLHHIEMRYESSSFELGWKISAATLIAAIVALSFPRRKRRIT